MLATISVWITQPLAVGLVVRVVQVGRVVGARRVGPEVDDPLVEQPLARLAIQPRVLGHEAKRVAPQLARQPV